MKCLGCDDDDINRETAWLCQDCRDALALVRRMTGLLVDLLQTADDASNDGSNSVSIPVVVTRKQ